jgi:hypothetical protein
MENRNQKTNGLAIAGFVLSFFSTVIGLILSIIALVQVKKTGEKGKGLAIAGIIISSVMTVVGVVIAILITTAAVNIASQTQLYNNAISEVNESVYSYNRLVDLEVNAVDKTDQAAFQAAAANDAAKMREVVGDIRAKISDLADNDIFEQDAEAQRLYDDLVSSLPAFESTFDQMADIYDRIAAGDYAAASEVYSLDIAGGDKVVLKLNTLNQYLSKQAASQTTVNQ